MHFVEWTSLYIYVAKFLKGLVDNNSKLVQVIALHRIGGQTITYTNDYPILLSTFASSGLNELGQSDQVCLISHEKDLAISPALFFNRTEI